MQQEGRRTRRKPANEGFESGQVPLGPSRIYNSSTDSTPSARIHALRGRPPQGLGSNAPSGRGPPTRPAARRLCRARRRVHDRVTKLFCFS